MIVNVYTGPNCGLCEQAIDLLTEFERSQKKIMFTVKKVNIRESTELYHLYAMKIPVLQIQGSKKELAWPFDIYELSEFLT